MNESQFSSERRQAARIVDSLECNLALEGFDVSSKTINISSRGVLCHLPEEIPLMTKVKLVLVLPGRLEESKGNPINLTGVVVRNERQESGVGTAIFFIDISKTHQMQLDSYIKNRLQDAT